MFVCVVLEIALVNVTFFVFRNGVSGEQDVEALFDIEPDHKFLIHLSTFCRGAPELLANDLFGRVHLFLGAEHE